MPEQTAVTIDLTPGAEGLEAWIAQLRARDFEPSAQDEAIRLWMLASAYPDAKAKDLLAKVAS